MSDAENVLGSKLQTCCTDPMTGFYRDGTCNTGAGDMGAHTVCARMTPVPAYQFPGLKPGDCWCLCASRWKEALDAGVAPPVVLEATHASTLEYASLDELKQHQCKQA
jgi:uncharacterized protein